MSLWGTLTRLPNIAIPLIPIDHQTVRLLIKFALVLGTSSTHQNNSPAHGLFVGGKHPQKRRWCGICLIDLHSHCGLRCTAGVLQDSCVYHMVLIPCQLDLRCVASVIGEAHLPRPLHAYKQAPQHTDGLHSHMQHKLTSWLCFGDHHLMIHSAVCPL